MSDLFSLLSLGSCIWSVTAVSISPISITHNDIAPIVSSSVSLKSYGFSCFIMKMIICIKLALIIYIIFHYNFYLNHLKITQFLFRQRLTPSHTQILQFTFFLAFWPSTLLITSACKPSKETRWCEGIGKVGKAHLLERSLGKKLEALSWRTRSEVGGVKGTSL